MNKRAFTLIELIVVIAIIAVLAAIIAPNAFKAIEKAKVSAFCADIKSVGSAVYALYADTGRFPCHYEDITCPLITGADCSDSGCGTGCTCGVWRNVAGWDGPYLEKGPGRYWLGRASMSFQNSCVDRGKDWDGDSGCELFFCYQSAPPVSAQLAIDRAIDGGDGPAAGMVRGRNNTAFGSTDCFWPGFANP